MPLSPILACEDVAAAIKYYTQTLRVELAWQMPPTDKGQVEFAGVKLGDAEILLGITEGFVALRMCPSAAPVCSSMSTWRGLEH